MSDEATLRVSLQITKDDAVGFVKYRSYPTDFTADVSGALGPTPGAFTVDTDGEDVNLTELTTPGFCKLTNEDSENFIEWGIREETTGKFYPVGEILPGEFFIIRLSRWLGREWTSPGTGTGTGEGSNNKLHVRADTAPCVVLVEAFEA